jgi:hypothetical protein
MSRPFIVQLAEEEGHLLSFDVHEQRAGVDQFIQVGILQMNREFSLVAPRFAQLADAMEAFQIHGWKLMREAPCNEKARTKRCGLSTCSVNSYSAAGASPSAGASGAASSTGAGPSARSRSCSNLALCAAAISAASWSQHQDVPSWQHQRLGPTCSSCLDLGVLLVLPDVEAAIGLFLGECTLLHAIGEVVLVHHTRVAEDGTAGIAGLGTFLEPIQRLFMFTSMNAGFWLGS